MAKLVVVVLIVSTILSVISLPISDSDIVSKCHNDPHVLYPTEDKKFRCHKCHHCPTAMGMSLLCEGQRVNSGQNVECVDCVTGSNYSNVDDYSQCIPCKDLASICKDQEIKGECVKGGDNRECIPCKKDWYYDRINKTCKACSCHNMTEEAKKSCFDLGFNLVLHCGNPNQTTPESKPGGESKKGMSTGIIFIIITVLALVIGLFCYGCCVGRRLKKFYVMQTRWPLGLDEWMHSIFCFHHSIANPAVCCGSDENQDATNGLGAQPTSKPLLYVRQSSWPVTSNEMKGVRERAKAPGYNLIAESDSQESTPRVRPKECLKEKLKVPELNVEVTEKMYRLLDVKLDVKPDLGIGYKTLAGRLGYTAEKLDEFALTGNPVEGLLRHWRRTDVTNNVLKLQQVLKGMKRDDIVDLLESELVKVDCQCSKCCAACIA